jgi:NAD(P)-dependent dehydrogenase (short-subunit alcohol dehydrogenase family)
MSSTTQALRPVLAERRIGVHGVYPAGIDTDMLAGIDLPKTPPAEIARGVLDGLASDLEDIFPDPNSEQMSTMWWSDPKSFERAFAAS